MLIAQMLDIRLEPEGDPMLIIDRLGAGHGDLVMITSDGLGLRKMLDDTTSPARWWTVALCSALAVSATRFRKLCTGTGAARCWISARYPAPIRP